MGYWCIVCHISHEYLKIVSLNGRILKIPYTAPRLTMIIVLQRPERTRRLLNAMKKRQSTFFGHCVRKGGLEDLVTTGRINEKRNRGRQREKIIDSLAGCAEAGSVDELIKRIRDRDR